MLDALKRGQGNVQIGDNHNLFDFTYVDNLVHAHILAFEKLEGTVHPDAFQERKTFSDRTVARRKVLPTTSFKPRDLIAEESYRPIGLETSSPDMSEKDFEVVENSVSSLKTSPSALKSIEEVEPPIPANRNRFDPFHTYLTDPPTSPIPIAGQVYFITDTEPVPFWDFSKLLFYHYNGFVAKKIWTIPKEFAWWMGLGGEWWTWIKGGGRAPLSRFTVVFMTSDRYFNTEKVRLRCLLQTGLNNHYLRPKYFSAMSRSLGLKKGSREPQR
jgi:sterol-4alpha-carboxylate 3-dehydrogenase (decarboxylating)